MSHVIKDFVIDYNSYAEENLMEYELYEEGLTYRYVYGVDKLGVTAYPIPNGSASVTTAEGTIPLYYHMDHMGSSEFLTSDVTHNAVLKCGQRELDLVKTYTGHERDGVLGMYYAKARLYDTADKHGSTKGNKLGDKRFMAVDPVKGNVRNPQSMVQYTYVQNNPILYVDPLGRMNYLTQLDDLISGAWMGVKESGAETLEAIKNIPQVPSMIYELVTGVYNQEIDMMELAKAMVKDGFSDATYLVNEINVINPFQANTNEEVSLYGKALGKSVTDIALAFVGGKVGKTVLDVLQKSKAGRRVIGLAKQIETVTPKYFTKPVCPKQPIDQLNQFNQLGLALQMFAENHRSPKGLIGHEFEEYLTKRIGGNGSFSVGGRDFDGGVGNRWWEAKSGEYWDMLMEKPQKLEKFKSDMGARLKIAQQNGATYELFSNTPIPDSIKVWLSKKGIPYTELLD